MLTFWDKIVGTWAVAAGISLAFTFFRQYRARPRYIYLLLFGVWCGLYGYQTLRQMQVLPRWGMWLVFGAAMAAMLRDSAARYTETRDRLRAERLARLRQGMAKPPDDPPPG